MQIKPKIIKKANGIEDLTPPGPIKYLEDSVG
jgi:hypothetical protein